MCEIGREASAKSLSDRRYPGGAPRPAARAPRQVVFECLVGFGRLQVSPACTRGGGITDEDLDVRRCRS